MEEKQFRFTLFKSKSNHLTKKAVCIACAPLFIYILYIYIIFLNAMICLCICENYSYATLYLLIRAQSYAREVYYSVSDVNEGVILIRTYCSCCPLQLSQGPVGPPGVHFGNHSSKSFAKLVKAKEKSPSCLT